VVTLTRRLKASVTPNVWVGGRLDLLSCYRTFVTSRGVTDGRFLPMPGQWGAKIIHLLAADGRSETFQMPHKSSHGAAGRRIAIRAGVMQRRQTTKSGDFEAILVEELTILKKGERRLQQLFPRLRSQPQLREYFLLELTAVRQRADRLHAVLDPVCMGETQIPVEAPTMRPAA
jgi:hypothetical protein